MLLAILLVATQSGCQAMRQRFVGSPPQPPVTGDSVAEKPQSLGHKIVDTTADTIKFTAAAISVGATFLGLGLLSLALGGDDDDDDCDTQRYSYIPRPMPEWAP